MESTIQTPPTISQTEARKLTDRIKRGAEALWKLIEDAWRSRAWEALGYAGWDEYCAHEFGTSKLRIPREERPEVVTSMRAAGMSVRAIESATGVSRSTISRELPSGVPDGTRAHKSWITGRDGKAYKSSRQRVVPQPPKPSNRTPLTVVPAPRAETSPKPTPVDRHVEPQAIEAAVATLLAALEAEDPTADSDERQELLRNLETSLSQRRRRWPQEKQPHRVYLTKAGEKCASAHVAAVRDRLADERAETSPHG